MAESTASRTNATCAQEEGPEGPEGPEGRFRSRKYVCSSRPAGLRQTTAVHSLTGQTRHSLIIFGPDLEPNSTDAVLSSKLQF